MYDVPPSLAVRPTTLPFSSSVTVTCASDMVAGVRSVDSLRVAVAAARSAVWLKMTEVPGIDWFVGITSAIASAYSWARSAKYVSLS